MLEPILLDKSEYLQKACKVLPSRLKYDYSISNTISISTAQLDGKTIPTAVRAL